MLIVKIIVHFFHPASNLGVALWVKAATKPNSRLKSPTVTLLIEAGPDRNRTGGLITDSKGLIAGRARLKIGPLSWPLLDIL
jgi:hypothetical protein